MFFTCCALAQTRMLHAGVYRGGSPTAVHAWQLCPLWEPSHSHPICRLGDLLCFVYLCVLVVFLCYFCIIVFLQCLDTVGWVFWPVKPVSQLAYTVLAGRTTLLNQSVNQCCILCSLLVWVCWFPHSFTEQQAWTHTSFNFLLFLNFMHSQSHSQTVKVQYSLARLHS